MTITDWTIDRRSADPARHMLFYVGSHMPRWLETSPVPLFVSARTLDRYRRRGDAFPKARCLWALDSGGFTELSMHGEWTLDADSYGGMVYRFMEDCGEPMFAAPQDWMCEPWIVAKTGFTVAYHQELTVENYLYLRDEFGHAPWIPVLQGWSLDDYLSHVEQYRAAGVDLASERLVGLGSVCRRQSTDEIGAIVSTLHGMGLRLHGFGVKRAGLARYGHMLASADSLAWSYTARVERVKLPECDHKGWCNNCLAYAVAWREEVLESLRTPKQLDLALFAGAS